MDTTSSADIPELRQLLQHAAPFLRIVDIDHATRWKGKKKEGDPRNGPWFGSVHEVLDQQVWDTRAECLYFLTDGRGQVRYVGESKNRVADRWRMPPAACAATGRDLSNRFVFHNRAWAPLQRELERYGRSAGPFTVSVLQGDALRLVVRANGTLSPLSALTNDEHLGRRVERWLCAHPNLRRVLWNVSGTSRRSDEYRGIERHR